MSDLNHKKLAEQFDELSALLSAIAGTFRNGGSNTSGKSVDGESEEPVRGTKSKAKPAASKSKAKAEPEEESELTIDEVREALKELVEVRGKEVMVQALESVGAGKLADVDESQYQELMDEVARLKEEEPEEAPTPKKGKKAPAKKAGPTADDLLEKFKELVASDRKKAKAVLAELGVEKISEVEEDDIQAAMDATVAALEGGE